MPVRCLDLDLLLAQTHKLVLLVVGLEAAVAELRRRVNELHGDLLDGVALRLLEEGLADGDDALLGADDAALDHDKVLADQAVVREAADRVDRLLRQVEVGAAAVGVARLANAVDLLVHLRPVVVAVLTRARDRVLHLGRVPRADARDLAQATVSLARQARAAPAGDDALVTLTLGDAHEVDHLVDGEDSVGGDLLLEVAEGEVDLVGNRAAVDLHLHHVRLLLPNLELAGLRVHDDADDLAIVLDALDLGVNVLLAVGVLLRVARESLLLRLVPVLVKAALHLVVEVLRPHGRERAEALRGLDVADNADANHRRRLKDGDGLDNLLLVRLRAGLVDVTQDVGHARLVGEERRQVAWLGLVVLGERLDLATVAARALAGQEAQGAVTRALELTVRHLRAQPHTRSGRRRGAARSGCSSARDGYERSIDRQGCV
mmetsp:Transcript_68995/g.206934  ORF Transcript_68995/g.206934 Transcript_68995/m.206934 type:complete len:433 (-) Transcript_68995:116-1414(-)